METKKKSASKDKGRKKSKSIDKKAKDEDVEMKSSGKLDMSDVKNRATIKSHKIDNVSKECYN